MFDYQGKTALVTGASSGIGKALAEGLAARGTSLVLVARKEDALKSLADELVKKHSIKAYVVPADLAQPDSVAKVKDEVTRLGLTIDVLVNNAGVLIYGPFEKNDAARDDGMVRVNVAALVALTHEFLPGMLERGSGGVINTSSTASFQPTPYLAVYAATKAFVSSFSVALWEECRGRNVHVMALCPGMTSTNLFEGSQTPVEALGSVRTPEQVAETALDGFARGRSLIVDGWKNYLVSFGGNLIPRWLSARVAASLMKPQSPAAAK